MTGRSGAACWQPISWSSLTQINQTVVSVPFTSFVGKRTGSYIRCIDQMSALLLVCITPESTDGALECAVACVAVQGNELEAPVLCVLSFVGF